MGLRNLCTRTFKYHYGGSFKVLCHYEFMIEMGQLMSENQVKKSLFCVASPHLTQLGEKALHKV